jgi:hypothetical protein
MFCDHIMQMILVKIVHCRVLCRAGTCPFHVMSNDQRGDAPFEDQLDSSGYADQASFPDRRV